LYSKNGRAVTNRGVSWPQSIIHTVSILTILPLGESISPTILLSNTLLHDTPSSWADLKFLPYVSQFTADSEQTILSFKGDARNGVHGFVIDAVSVVEVTETERTKVPEPSAVLGLLALSGCSLGMLRRRKV